MSDNNKIIDRLQLISKHNKKEIVESFLDIVLFMLDDYI